MQNIVITTQYRENYGAHSWDGKGECPQYWKNKGGHDYMVTDIDVNGDIGAIVEAAIAHFGCSYANDYSEEYVIDWFVTDDDLTPQERQWIEWEGKVTYPSKKVAQTELNAVAA